MIYLNVTGGLFMFLYKNAIECLIENIPELKSLYEEDQEYYEDLPYVFYESVFTKYIVEMLEKKMDSKLVRCFDFVEKGLSEGDTDFKNLLEVSVIEALFFEGKFNDKYTLSFLGKTSQQNLRKCNNI